VAAAVVRQLTGIEPPRRRWLSSIGCRLTEAPTSLLVVAYIPIALGWFHVKSVAESFLNWRRPYERRPAGLVRSLTTL